MTKKEVVQVLAMLRAIYPVVKIENAEALATGWMLVLGDYSASAVFKAARLHLETSKYFPTPAEVKEKIMRAELVYSDNELDQVRLSAGGQMQASEADITFDSLIDLEPTGVCLNCPKKNECFSD